MAGRDAMAPILQPGACRMYQTAPEATVLGNGGSSVATWPRTCGGLVCVYLLLLRARLAQYAAGHGCRHKLLARLLLLLLIRLPPLAGPRLRLRPGKEQGGRGVCTHRQQARQGQEPCRHRPGRDGSAAASAAVVGPGV